MGEWDRDKGRFGGNATEDLLVFETNPSPATPRPWYQHVRRLTDAEKTERNTAEWKAAKLRSIV